MKGLFESMKELIDENRKLMEKEESKNDYHEDCQAFRRSNFETNSNFVQKDDFNTKYEKLMQKYTREKNIINKFKQFEEEKNI
jgi:hypothetical protein